MGLVACKPGFNIYCSLKKYIKRFKLESVMSQPAYFTPLLREKEFPQVQQKLGCKQGFQYTPATLSSIYLQHT